MYTTRQNGSKVLIESLRNSSRRKRTSQWNCAKLVKIVSSYRRSLVKFVNEKRSIRCTKSTWNGNYWVSRNSAISKRFRWYIFTGKVGWKITLSLTSYFFQSGMSCLTNAKYFSSIDLYKLSTSIYELYLCNYVAVLCNAVTFHFYQLCWVVLGHTCFWSNLG